MSSSSSRSLHDAFRPSVVLRPLDVPSFDALSAVLRLASGGGNDSFLACPIDLVDVNVSMSNIDDGDRKNDVLSHPRDYSRNQVIASLSMYAKDKSQFHEPPAHLPIFVVAPNTIQGVADVIRACRKHQKTLGCVVVVRGAGTGVEGGAVPYQKRAVVLSTRNLNEISICDAADNAAVVGAGVLKNELNKYLKKYNVFFGPDPSSNPTIGGMISTSGSGMSTLRYGTTRENVLALTVVTPAGDIIETRRPTRKNATGYNLTHLYIGGEGTLGVVCRAVLRVRPILPIRSGGVLTFPTVALACQTAVQVSQLADTDLTAIVRCEMLNEEGVKCTNEVFGTTLDVVPTMFVELQGSDVSRLEEQWRTLVRIAKGSLKQTYAGDGDKLDELWDARRGCYIAACKYRKLVADKEGVPRAGPPIDNVLLTDVCVPLSELADVVDATETDFKVANVPCVMCCRKSTTNHP